MYSCQYHVEESNIWGLPTNRTKALKVTWPTRILDLSQSAVGLMACHPPCFDLWYILYNDPLINTLENWFLTGMDLSLLWFSFVAEDRGGSVWEHPVAMVTTGVEAQPRVLRDGQEGWGAEEENHRTPWGQVPTGEIVTITNRAYPLAQLIWYPLLNYGEQN